MEIKFKKFFILLTILSTLETKNIFMSTEGNDETGDGSIENPYLTLMKCQSVGESGDIVYIRGGTYKNFEIAESTSTYNYIQYFTKSGLTYKAYESEKVIFDFEFAKKYLAYNGQLRQRVSGFMIIEGVENLTFENFDCIRIPTLSWDEIVAAKLSKNLTQSECFQSRGNNIRFNRINAYNNNGIGFYFLGTKSYNIAYRCDAYNNTGLDKGSLGNADGFGSHGSGAEFIECRAWDNSDDNYDCINSYKTTIFDKSWAFRINYKNSDIQDGNGFKVGGWGKSADAKKLYKDYSGDNPPVHIVKNCIAASNKANGFYSNHQPGQAAVWYNNRAYNNKANFDMTEGSETWELDSKGKVVDICGTREVLYFNFGHKYSAKLSTECNMYGNEGNLFSANIPDENNQFNSWNFRDITLSNDDFLSLDVTELAKARGPDGSLPEVNFMKLDPIGPNYEMLKTIEEKMKNYEIKDDGTIVKIKDDEIIEEEEAEESNSCSNIPNCKTCVSETECSSCIDGYYLVEGNDGNIRCQNIDISKYYTIIKKDRIYYIKCDKYMPNCITCSDSNTCTKCENNYYMIGDDNSQCVDISGNNYYYDINSNQYKECSDAFPNCELCIIDNKQNLICKQCSSEYALKNDAKDNIVCDLLENLEENNLYYTNDSGINYYSCSNSLYNSVSNCKECENGNSCSLCQNDYSLVNNNQKCIDLNEVNNKIIYYNSIKDLYTSCSDLIQLCYKCENEATCIECNSNAFMEENDKCISSELVNNKYYYLNEATIKYESCSKIDNCLKCTSNDVCILCKDGFTVNNDSICERVLRNEDNDDKLSTGSIIGIVIGLVVFLCIIGFVVYFLIKRAKNNNINIIESVEKTLENPDKIAETEKIDVKSTKRTIHNS